MPYKKNRENDKAIHFNESPKQIVDHLTRDNHVISFDQGRNVAEADGILAAT